ncbi:MAG: hypothetical protein ACNA8W_11625 [Bradymonadaceae bacterium]
MSDDKSRRGNRSNYGDRDNKKGGSRAKKERDRRSSASYKSDLDKLFKSGGDVPDRFQGIMGQLKPEEGTPEAERMEAIEGLRQADSFRDFIDAVNAYREAGFALPDDEDLLTRMLDHPREGVLIQILAHLIDLRGRREISRPGPLIARLETVKTMSDDPKIHELADRLKEVL